MKNKHRISISLLLLTVAAIVAASVAAVSCSAAIFASIYSSALTESAQVNAERTVKQAAISVDNTIRSMRSQLNGISALLKDVSNDAETAEKIGALAGVKKDIIAVTVYGTGGEIIMSVGGGRTLKSRIYKDLSFDKELFDSAPEFSISRPHVQTVFDGSYPWVVTAAVKPERPVLGNGVYIAVDFSFSGISDYIDKVGVGQRGYCYITDVYGKIIYHPQQQVLFSGLKPENGENGGRLSTGTYTEKGKITSVSPSSDGRWKIIGVSYTDELEREKTAQILFSITAAFFCCAAVSSVLIIVYQKTFNRPVKELIKAMKAFETQADSFVYLPKRGAVTELTELNFSFAHMTRKIKNLMERVRKEETELRKTELKALQAQINPHFLYNTLDSIQWMCEQGKTQDAASMVSALARLFRISISRGRELIPIKDELQHAKSYLIIQSYRYKNQFTYTFDADEKLSGYLCNKITVQPLIENAIYHGIDRMVDEGKISVSVFEAPDCRDDILITVSDNGVGMTAEQCKKILEKGRSDSSGIGVKNVNDRLKIYFGEKYGITVESELDVGTTVTVRIPKIEKEAEE